MSYSTDPITMDCYEGTTCLINKFNITDEEKLTSLEADISLMKSAQLEKSDMKADFNEEDYKELHRYLLGDIYDWAGEYRSINMTKKGTKFAECDRIPELMNRCFARLKKLNYFLDTDFDEFIDELVDFYCTINHIHPFREGNGRVQRVFITQLVRYNGCDINFSQINTDDLMVATIHSAQGVTDYLHDIFYRSIAVVNEE